MTILNFKFKEKVWETYKYLGSCTNRFIRVKNYLFRDKIVYTNKPYIEEGEIPLYFNPRELKKLLKQLELNES